MGLAPGSGSNSFSATESHWMTRGHSHSLSPIDLRVVRKNRKRKDLAMMPLAPDNRWDINH